jgi:hypothetical protein
MLTGATSGQALRFALAALIVIVLVVILSISLLPPAPLAPTPTWPLGIDLPEARPRIPR